MGNNMNEKTRNLRTGLIGRQATRALPVIVMADISGSMSGEKIAALNEALRQMLESFRGLDSPRRG